MYPNCMVLYCTVVITKYSKILLYKEDKMPEVSNPCRLFNTRLLMTPLVIAGVTRKHLEQVIAFYLF